MQEERGKTPPVCAMHTHDGEKGLQRCNPSLLALVSEAHTPQSCESLHRAELPMLLTPGEQLQHPSALARHNWVSAASVRVKF